MHRRWLGLALYAAGSSCAPDSSVQANPGAAPSAPSSRRKPPLNPAADVAPPASPSPGNDTPEDAAEPHRARCDAVSSEQALCVCASGPSEDGMVPACTLTRLGVPGFGLLQTQNATHLVAQQGEGWYVVSHLVDYGMDTPTFRAERLIRTARVPVFWLEMDMTGGCDTYYDRHVVFVCGMHGPGADVCHAVPASMMTGNYHPNSDEVDEVTSTLAVRVTRDATLVVRARGKLHHEAARAKVGRFVL